MTKTVPSMLTLLSLCIIVPAHAAEKRERVYKPYYGGMDQTFGHLYRAYGPPAYCYASPEPAFCPAPRQVSGYVVH
jgi:hypothetical protein